MNITQQQNLTPRQIVEELDKYVIGQKEAKRSVSIALRNRWRRLKADPEIRDEIIPNNILMIGPTGVGKTEIARRLAKLAGAPFIKVEASKFTEVGYVGRDVESMIRDLTDLAVNMVKEEMQERVKEKAAEIVEEKILDILIPPVKAKSRSNSSSNQKEVGFNADEASNAELNERTRERFREKLKNGELEDRNIEIEVQSSKTPMMQVFGPQGMEEMGVNLQDMLGNLRGGGKKTKRTLPIHEAREVLIDQESEKLVDHEAAVQEAIERVHNQGIVFIDEIDKVASDSSSGGKGGGGSADVSRQGVQRDLLPIVEGSTVNTKHGIVKTDHILFIGSGAFHVSKPSDLIPELQGRFPIRVELNSLTEEDFFNILTQPKNALTKQYQAMLKSEGVTVDFTKGAVRQIAKIAAEVNQQVENIGARRLHTILSSLLEELLFAVPDDIGSGEITIDESYVHKQLDGLVKNKDLSHYIL
ncbi:ATP-dependent protease ATPase subunit HslU [Rhodohalobacter sulfatireducens]|uniref:ATP-dependent protease ATPase subunit HslU n=1 Tax=Rhodohalobacter sulfatireducens TaxID=2911366 RepID=A0ABS9KDI0_9BACT|nr:ATP-dependent protease ATPase subunit HslU [Rhodohalobacter sulfatireducens]MCG2588891.1 ATP-dependent protease ATPase subunit HslU [Rhodohalobacter sulfatireducens]MDR9364357.1 ATP-dependent protease ATPase subunit HslU [Balneolaceae bacterium]